MKEDNLTKWNKAFWIILAISILLRIIWLSEFPHSIYSPDSLSYTAIAHDILETGKTHITMRTLGYPLFLIPIISIAGDYLAVVIVQMVLGILIAVILYHLFWEFYPKQKISLWLFGLIILCSYHLNYESLIGPELLLAFFLTICFWLIVRLHKAPKFSHFFWLGLIAGLSTITKPAIIYFIILGLIISILTFYKTKDKFKKILISSIIFYLPYLVVLGGQATFNYYHNDFFGQTSIGGSNLFGSSARFLDLDKPTKNKEIKKLIKPYIIEYRKLYSQDKANAMWLLFHKDGPSKIMRKYVKGSALEYDKLCKELGIEAITSHPFRFAYEKTKDIIELLFFPHNIGMNLNRPYDRIVHYSWQSLPKKLLSYNKTHPKVDFPDNMPIENYKRRPFKSIGSFVRRIYILSPAVLPTIWAIGLFLSFYFLFIRYRVFPIMSVLTSAYVLILFHLAIHTIAHTSMRFVYPVYSLMIFFTFMLLAESKWVDKIVNKRKDKKLSIKKA